MRPLTIEVSEEIAERWDGLARDCGLPTETWIAFCLHTCERLEFPITQLLFRIPPAERSDAGVYWEIGYFKRTPRVEGSASSRRERLAEHQRRLHAFAEEATR